MALFSYTPYPATIQSLTGTVVGAATRLGFHGRARVSKEGDLHVITLPVKDIPTILAHGA